jgi:hypothetical protein
MPLSEATQSHETAHLLAATRIQLRLVEAARFLQHRPFLNPPERRKFN